MTIAAVGFDCVFIGDADVTVAPVKEIVEISGISIIVVIVVRVFGYTGEIISVGSVMLSGGASVVLIFETMLRVLGSGDFRGGVGGSTTAAADDVALPVLRGGDRGEVAVVRVWLGRVMRETASLGAQC